MTFTHASILLAFLQARPDVVFLSLVSGICVPTSICIEIHAWRKRAKKADAEQMRRLAQETYETYKNRLGYGVRRAA